MRRSTSLSLPSFASAALALVALAMTGACAGATTGRGTGDADTVDDGGSDEDDDDDDDDDSSPTGADDDADTQGSADDSPSDDGDASSSDDASDDDDTTSAVTADDDTTTDPSATSDDAGTTDGGESSSDGGSSDDSTQPGTVDLSGFILLQTDSDREITIPDGTIVPVGGAIVIGRDASVGQFEDFWSVSLDDVVYIDGGDLFPTCNGDETFSLLTPLRTLVDGPTPALVISTGMTRTDASADASELSAWSTSAVPNTDATPGSGPADGGETGVPYISEIVDATGAGNFPFEFVEIHVAP